jgi:hypothetical protein
LGLSGRRLALCLLLLVVVVALELLLLLMIHTCSSLFPWPQTAALRQPLLRPATLKHSSMARLGSRSWMQLVQLGRTRIL